MQLSNLESYQQRIAGRAYGDKRRLWGKISSTSAEFEPNSTTLATYEIENTEVEFGINSLLLANHPYIAGDFTVDAGVAFGNATADVSVGGGAGEISTNSIKFAISATWESDDSVYWDGQFQYVTFENDIETDTKLASVDASSYSVGAEIGWGAEFDGFSVMPSAQIAWTSVDFGDFTDSAGTAVTLDDGDALGGRIGVAVEREWKSILPEDLLLCGRADLLAHLEGEVATNSGGMKMLSERKDPSINIGLGASYAWDGFDISADVSTQQGRETAGYAGSIGIKYRF